MDSITNAKKIRIPKDYLTFEKTEGDELKNCMRRFLFVDSNLIKIISEDGFEKLIDISENRIQEIAFNKVPLFEKDEIDDLENGHYYIKKSKIETCNPEVVL